LTEIQEVEDRAVFEGGPIRRDEMSSSTSFPGTAISRKSAGADDEKERAESPQAAAGERKKVVVVGLGMVGIAFM